MSRNWIFITKHKNDADMKPLIGEVGNEIPLQYGDFFFFGLWEDGKEVRVSGERKKLGDLVACILNGRHVQQLRDAKGQGYEFHFLIIEAEMRPNPKNGLLQHRLYGKWVDFRLIPDEPKSTIEYFRVDDYLNEIAWYAGVVIKYSSSAKETADQVIGIYEMFQKAPREHTSLNKFYTSPPPVVSFLVGRPGLLRRIAKEYDGIGWEKSLGVETFFEGSVRAFNHASSEELQQAEGIGKKLAQSIVEERDR